MSLWFEPYCMGVKATWLLWSTEANNTKLWLCKLAKVYVVGWADLKDNNLNFRSLD